MKIKIDSLDTIHEAAKEFLQNMGDGKVFAFYGKMGAGKTTFVKAICEELGVEDVITSFYFGIMRVRIIYILGILILGHYVFCS